MTISSNWSRSEEHTSELQSRPHLVCRLLLEKKKIVILKLSFFLFEPLFFIHRLSAFPSNSFFFFNDTATTEIYTLSLHDALPISPATGIPSRRPPPRSHRQATARRRRRAAARSEEHTSELQSRPHLVCRLLL